MTTILILRTRQNQYQWLIKAFRAFLNAILSVVWGVPVDCSAYSSDMELDIIEDDVSLREDENGESDIFFVLFLGADKNCLGCLSTLLGYFFFPKFAWILPSMGSPQSLSKNRRSPSVHWEQKPAPPMAYPLSSNGFNWKCLGMSIW